MALVQWMALSLTTLVAPRTAPAPQVVWIDLAGVPAATEQAARREAEAALAEVGIVPRWREGTAQELLAPNELAVVLVPRDLSRRRGSERMLGACHPRSDSPRAWVYLDNLSWALGDSARNAAGSHSEPWRLGRALGRIVAHEVIHAVAPAVQHARAGIMSARLDRRDLLAIRLAVDPVTRRGVQAVLAVARASSPLPRS